MIINVSGEREREGNDVLDDLWRNYFAGTAPGCKTVENDDVVLEGFSEGGFAALGC
jgi:hypothetical protein